jgi:hypothetical protein
MIWNKKYYLKNKDKILAKKKKIMKNENGKK